MPESSEVIELQKKLAQQQNVTKILQREFAQEKAQLMTYIHSLEQLNSQTQVDSKIMLQNDLNLLKRNLEKKMSEQNELHERLTLKEKEFRQIEEEFNNMKQDNLKLQEEVRKLKQANQDLEKEYCKLQDQTTIYNPIQNDELEQELINYSLQKELTRLNEKLKIKNDLLSQMEIENNTLIKNQEISQLKFETTKEENLKSITLLQKLLSEKDEMIKYYQQLDKINDLAKEIYFHNALEKEIPNLTSKMRKEYEQIVIEWERISQEQNSLRYQIINSKSFELFQKLNNILGEIINKLERLIELTNQKIQMTQAQDHKDFLQNTLKFFLVALNSLNQMKELLRQIIAKTYQHQIDSAKLYDFKQFKQLSIQILKRILRNLLFQCYQNIWSFYEQILVAFSLYDAEVVTYNKMQTDTLMDDIQIWDDDYSNATFHNQVTKFQLIEGIIKKIIPGRGEKQREIIETFLDCNQSLLWVIVFEMENYLEQMKFINK